MAGSSEFVTRGTYVLPTEEGVPVLYSERSQHQQLMCLVFAETAKGQTGVTAGALLDTLRADLRADDENVAQLEAELALLRSGRDWRLAIEANYQALLADLVKSGAVRLLDPADPGDV